MNKKGTTQDINEQIKEMTATILKQVEENVPSPPPDRAFDSLPLLRKKAVENAKVSIGVAKEKFESGMQAILSVLKELDPDSYNYLGIWFITRADSIQQLLASENHFLENETISDKISLPNELLAVMYLAVQELVKQGKYSEAGSAILICINFEPRTFDFWLTYGQIMQAQGDDVGALYAFQMGLIFSQDNPSALAHMAKSWITLGQPAEALTCIKQALHFSEGTEEATAFTDYCKAIFNYCSQKIAKI